MAIAIQTLRDEGVLEIGAIAGTCFVYVTTRQRMCLFHAAELPRRRLDAYGAQRAIFWIEKTGIASGRLAENLGIAEEELRRALLAAGYERESPAQIAQRSGARGQKKLGNRRGRLTQIDAGPVMAPRPRNPLFNEKSAVAGMAKRLSRGPWLS